MPSNDTLVYLCYDRSPQVDEVLFAMLTLARFPTEELAGLRVLAMTDQPDLFRSYGLEALPVSPEDIDRWKGPHRFGHRCKVVSLGRLLDQFGGRCLLVDGDTYFTRPPRHVFRRIGPGRSVMHMPLGRLADSKIEMCRRFGEILESDPMAAVDHPGPRRDRWSVQWNSGVLGLDASDAPIVDEVLELVDAILARYHAIAVEQLAFSLVFTERTRVQPSRDCIFHYNVSPERQSFRAALPELLERARPMPPVERARWLFERRLKLSPGRKARIMAKDVLNYLHVIPAVDRCDCL